MVERQNPYRNCSTFKERTREMLNQKCASMTLIEHSKAAGLPEGAIQNLTGPSVKTMPRTDTVCILADYFNCSVDWLLGREGNFYP